MKTRNKIVLLVALILLTLAFTGCALFDSTSIESLFINSDGELVITYTNGKSENLGTIVGKDGRDGIDGKDGIDGIDGRDGIDGTNGKDGIDGKDGKDGTDGKDGEITITGEGESTSIAAAKAMRSAVSVVCDLGDGTYSSGSGVVYKYNENDDGYFIITNYHVVYSADMGIIDDINVLLYGNEYLDGFIPATYVGGSMNYDIAVLFIENTDVIRSSPIVPVDVASSDEACVGEKTIVIGNARGEGISVSSGVLSVDSESIEMVAADEKTEVAFRVMRTDAPVNRGNSGGGLFNANGELIGIVNAKIIVSGVEGIGYAIPSNLACNVADNIIDNCYKKDCSTVQRALLGITVTTSESKSVYDPTSGKIQIEETIIVYEVSATCLFGNDLLPGDVIKSIILDGLDEKAVTRQFHVIDYLLQARIGDTGILRVERLNGETGEYEEVKLSFIITEHAIVSY